MMITNYKNRVQSELQSNQDFAEAIEISFTNYIDNIWNSELSLGLAITSERWKDTDDIVAYLKEVAGDQSIVNDYAWLNTSGKMIADSSKEIKELSPGEREYIDRILKGEDRVVSDVVTFNTHNKPGIIIARAIKNNGKLVGIITAAIDARKLGKCLPEKRVNSYSSFGLIDTQRNFVYKNGDADIAARSIKVSVDSPAAIALKGATFITDKYTPGDGIKYMSADVPIRKIGWAAYANSNRDYVLLNITYQLMSFITAFIIVIILCLLASIKICNRILKPIGILKKAAQEIAKGNMNIRTEIRGDDELAEAAQAFDHMINYIEEYDNLKSEFFSTISHELRTPLNIILTSIQMIESMHVTQDKACEHYNATEKYINGMRQNSYRLLRLINNLIDITRVESGFIKMNMNNCNIISIVEDITLSVVQYAEVKGIKLIFDTEVEEKIIACDPDTIERIMLNLLSNAIKFTLPQGSIYVNVFDKKDTIMISVKDTGIGIPEDKIPIIFERFRQVDSSLQRQYEGSGIGLSLVKSLVEAQGGNITAKSEYGHGTEFIVSLPVKILSMEEVHEESYDKRNMDKVQKISIELSDIYFD